LKKNKSLEKQIKKLTAEVNYLKNNGSGASSSWQSRSNLTCFHCGGGGHTRYDCKKKDQPQTRAGKEAEQRFLNSRSRGHSQRSRSPSASSQASSRSGNGKGRGKKGGKRRYRG
jgi:hypothetical protein